MVNVKSLIKSVKGKIQQTKSVIQNNVEMRSIKEKKISETEQLRRGLDSLYSLYEKTPSMQKTRSQLQKEQRAANARARRAEKIERRKQTRIKRQDNAQKARDAKGQLPHPSSWIKKIGYNASTQTLWMQTKGRHSHTYRWSPVSRDEYQAWLEADYACQTNDPSGRNRWRIGKTPSHGATWHQRIKYIVRQPSLNQSSLNDFT